MNLPLYYYNSRLAALWLLGLTFPAFLGCSWLFCKIILHKSTPSYWLIWLFEALFGLFSAFFGTITILIIRRLFTRRPRLTLTASGITDSTSKVGEIEWSDIEVANLYNGGRGRTTICLRLRNAHKYMARLSIIGRFARINWLANSQLILNLSGTKAKAQEVLVVIKSQISQHT